MASKATIPVLVACMLLTGVSNTLLTKYQDMQCVRHCNTSRARTFEQPVIQTLQMFIGESGCWLVVLGTYLFQRLRRAKSTTSAQDISYQPVRGSEEAEAADQQAERDLSSIQTPVDPTNVVSKPIVDGEELHVQRRPLTGWKPTLLALPTICDVLATTLMNVGLLFVAASIYQMTRGALVLFVGLFSVIFLRRHLSGWKWASLIIVVLGVAIVGLAGASEKKDNPPSPPGDTRPGHENALDLTHHVARAPKDALSTIEAHTAAETVMGVLMIACAQIFTASHFVLEESIMEKYSMEPIRVVGWEGTFGVLITSTGIGILHAWVGSTPAGKGGYFDAGEGFWEVFHNRAIAVTSVLIMISIGGFNFFGLSVTRSISATSRSTIDTCRTLFIWIVSLGLGWETFKWLQVLGFALLVYGTGLFNDIIRPPTIAFLRRRRDRVIAIGGQQ